MKNTLALVVTIMFGAIAVADEWGAPTEKDYFSANGRYVAHVAPAKGEQKPRLDVLEIGDSTTVPLWACDLRNREAPVEVYASDDGRFVITCNEWGSVGYGDLVVAFYGRNGLIKNYSMEQILHLPPDLSSAEMAGLVPYSTSSGWWDQNSIKFLDTQAGKPCFCIWLHLFDRWAAWDASTGRELTVDDTMSKQWNDKARQWSLRQIREKKERDTPYEFLGKMKTPEDRPLIEALLSDRNFSCGGYRSTGLRLEMYWAQSEDRALAERLLARWDGKPTEPRASVGQPLHSLGRVEGLVTLPRTPDPNQATLWVYLVRADVAKNRWRESAPVHRLVVSFSDYAFRTFDLGYTEKFPFAISTVTPGRYWVKAVLDKTVPLSKAADPAYAPQRGDYESVDSPVITVIAGKTESVSIDCMRKVADGTD